MGAVVGHRLGFGLHVRDELWLPGAKGSLHGMRFDRRRVLLAEAEHQLGLRRIQVAGADAAEYAVLVEVDRDMRQPRHGESAERQRA